MFLCQMLKKQKFFLIWFQVQMLFISQLQKDSNNGDVIMYSMCQCACICVCICILALCRFTQLHYIFFSCTNLAVSCYCSSTVGSLRSSKPLARAFPHVFQPVWASAAAFSSMLDPLTAVITQHKTTRSPGLPVGF